MLFAAIHFQCDRASVRETQCGLEAFGQALLDIGLDLYTVDHDIDRVFLGFLQFRQVVDFDNFGGAGTALDAKTHEALCLHLLEQIGVFSFSVGDDWRQDHQFGVFRQGQRCIDHLRYRLRGQRMFRMIGAIRRADACV